MLIIPENRHNLASCSEGDIEKHVVRNVHKQKAE